MRNWPLRPARCCGFVFTAPYGYVAGIVPHLAQIGEIASLWMPIRKDLLHGIGLWIDRVQLHFEAGAGLPLKYALAWGHRSHLARVHFWD